MPFMGGHPPGPHAGDMSPLTEALRPSIPLAPTECEKARRLRRAGKEIPEIAARLAAPEADVRQALATMRTRRPFATRGSLNVTVAAHEFVASEAEDGEALWETMDRLLGELTMRRALAGAAVSRSGQR